jgi:hypothetical protein
VEAIAGRQLGPVRVHDDAPARAAAGLLGARAFTIGQDIYLGDGARSAAVLDHEAVHTLRQRPWQGEPLRFAGPGAHEREAERVAAGQGPATIAGLPPAPMAAAGPFVAAVLAGELACMFGFFLHGMFGLGTRKDAYLHCWTSCKIATRCPPLAPLTGAAMALLIGAIKEIFDIVLGEAEIRDMQNNVHGVGCSFDFLTSCDACCEKKLRAGKLAAAEGRPEAESPLDAEAAREAAQAVA